MSRGATLPNKPLSLKVGCSFDPDKQEDINIGPPPCCTPPEERQESLDVPVDAAAKNKVKKELSRRSTELNNQITTPEDLKPDKVEPNVTVKVTKNAEENQQEDPIIQESPENSEVSGETKDETAENQAEGPSEEPAFLEDTPKENKKRTTATRIRRLTNKSVPLPPIQGTTASVSPQTSLQLSSFSHLPSDLKGLTVEEVSECLRLLNLAHHVEKFRHSQIDGVLLMDIDRNMLKQELNFTEFETMKMLKFLHCGWRPREK